VTYNRALLEKELISDEGLKLRAYFDTASPPRATIGVGRNLDDIGIRPAESKVLGITTQSAMRNGISHDQALDLLDNDILDREQALDKRLSWWRTLSDVRQRALLNLAFQLGVNGLLTFKATLAALQAGAYATAASGIRNSLYARQVPARAERIAHMIEMGQTA
jgi:lysozyme